MSVLASYQHRKLLQLNALLFLANTFAQGFAELIDNQ